MKKKISMDVPKEIIRFIGLMTEYEYEKQTIKQNLPYIDKYIEACDRLINCVVEISGRDMEEIVKFYQEIYDMDLPFNNPFPTSYFILMKELLDSLKQNKDKENDVIELKADENKLIQIVTLFKVDLVKTKENLK